MSTDVQPENDFFKMPNELYEALCKLHISGYENQITRTVIRLTYGYNRESVKITQEKFQEISGIKQIPRISEAVNNLVSLNILHKSGKIFSLNKQYKIWKLRKTGNNKVTEKRKKSYGKPEVQLRKTVNFSDQLKDNLKNNKNIYTTLLEHWNSLNIIQHRKAPKSGKSTFHSVVDSLIKEFTEDEIKQAMINYSKIVNSSEYYFTYKWTVTEFFIRGFEYFRLWEVANTNYRNRNWKATEEEIKF